MPDRPRLVPTPPPNKECAVHAVCPVGHLKAAAGAFPANTPLALMSEGGGNTVCYTMTGQKATFRTCQIAVTFPVLAKYSHNVTSKSLSFRFRPCIMDNANAFQKEFSADGYN